MLLCDAQMSSDVRASCGENVSGQALAGWTLLEYWSLLSGDWTLFSWWSLKISYTYVHLPFRLCLHTRVHTTLQGCDQHPSDRAPVDHHPRCRRVHWRRAPG